MDESFGTYFLSLLAFWDIRFDAPSALLGMTREQSVE